MVLVLEEDDSYSGSNQATRQSDYLGAEDNTIFGRGPRFLIPEAIYVCQRLNNVDQIQPIESVPKTSALFDPYVEEALNASYATVS